MLQITPQMKILVALEPIDFRQGIDGLAQACRERLQTDPFTGAVFVFRNRARTAIKVLSHDGFGWWLCHRRFAEGRLRWWPTARTQDDETHATNHCVESAARLLAHELQVLINGGDPTGTRIPPAWKPIPTSA
jgi:transposase